MTATGKSSAFLILSPALCWVVLAAVGYHPTLSAAGTAGVRAMAVAQGLVAAVIYVTLVPAMRQIRQVPPAERLQAGLKMGVVRFAVTLAISGLLAWRHVLPPAPLLVWVGVTYVVMIQVETIALVCWMKRLEETR